MRIGNRWSSHDVVSSLDTAISINLERLLKYPDNPAFLHMHITVHVDTRQSFLLPGNEAKSMNIVVMPVHVVYVMYNVYTVSS